MKAADTEEAVRQTAIAIAKAVETAREAGRSIVGHPLRVFCRRRPGLRASSDCIDEGPNKLQLSGKSRNYKNGVKLS